ncbi:hypothetical protein BJY04DRAFT_219365 [Aspergillus karnatakaensis]|uniref:Zn(II)2Cys6 transcription factor domain-containing protein n=1 Tax=Aspergillus karnatakaensis TaxID=1810916 RepID=UPI003CCD10C1
MFGMLRLDPQSDNHEFIERANGTAYSQLGYSLPPRSACDSCREKKLRCSGHKSGCRRCKNNHARCTYSSTFDAGAKRQRYPAQLQTPPNDRISMKDTDEQCWESITCQSTRRISSVSSTPQASPLKSTTSPKIAAGDDSLGPNLITEYPLQDWSLAGLDQTLLSGWISTPLSTPLEDVWGCNFSGPTNRNPQGPGSLSQAAEHETEQVRGMGAAQKMQDASLTPRGQCDCLLLAAPMLEELENKLHCVDTEPHALDTVLAWQKDACTDCNKMLRCLNSAGCSEHIMLLAFACDKVARLGCRINSHYFECCAGQGQPQQPRTAKRLDGGGTSGYVRSFFVGDYELDKPNESLRVIRVLIELQLRDLRTLVEKSKLLAHGAAMITQLAVLRQTERRIIRLIEQIKSYLECNIEL